MSSQRPTAPHGARLLARLDEPGAALARRDDAIALIGLGSVGADLARFDEHMRLIQSHAVDRIAAPDEKIESAAVPRSPRFAPGDSSCYAQGRLRQYEGRPGLGRSNDAYACLGSGVSCSTLAP